MGSTRTTVIPDKQPKDVSRPVLSVQEADDQFDESYWAQVDGGTDPNGRKWE
jgi:hypothetical protein